MCHGPTLAGLQRQARLGAVEGLDLALLVDRDNDGVGRRVHIEADDVLDLLGEGWIGGPLEGADAVGLETGGFPEALHCPQADTGGLGNHAARPMGGLPRRLAAGKRQDLCYGPRGERRLAGLARFVVQKPVNAFLGETLLPAPHRRAAHLGPASHIDGRQPVRRKDDDLRPLNVLLWAVAIADDRRQSRAVLGAKQNTDSLSHAARIAYFTLSVNLTIASVH